MNNRFLILVSLIASSALILSGCGDNSSFEDPGAVGDNEIAPADTVITQIADQNSFDLAFEKLAVEAIGRVGDTNLITVRVADRNNNPVPDNTAIRFLTNGGSIEPQCLTTIGTCTVTWTEQAPTPANFKAIVIAYTTGEESFTDLNDNGMYDSGETFTDIPEPFFDLNEDGIRDANTEEFVDADGDNIYDVANGLFTGSPCVGDNTVCDRRTTLIWQSQDIILSNSSADAINTTIDALPSTVDTQDLLTLVVQDEEGNPMPDGTIIALSSEGGEVDPTSINMAPLADTFTISYTSGSTEGQVEVLKIEITTPLGSITTFLIPGVALTPAP